MCFSRSLRVSARAFVVAPTCFTCSSHFLSRGACTFLCLKQQGYDGGLEPSEDNLEDEYVKAERRRVVAGEADE